MDKETQPYPKSVGVKKVLEVGDEVMGRIFP